MKIRFGAGGIIFLLALLLSKRGEVFLVFTLAALIHELGHFIAAKALKIGIGEIKFGIFGVRIYADIGLGAYFSEFILALMGPLFNFLAIVALFIVFLNFDMLPDEVLKSGMIFFEHGGADLIGAGGFFIISSAIQAFINLLPVKTLDGGRMLYSATAAIFSLDAAERVISIATTLSAFFLWTLALYLMLKVASGITAFVLAIYIFLIATGEGGHGGPRGGRGGDACLRRPTFFEKKVGKETFEYFRSF